MAIRANTEGVREGEELIGSALVANQQAAHLIDSLVARLKRDNSLSISDLPKLSTVREWIGASDELLDTYRQNKEISWRRIERKRKVNQDEQ